ncbi:molecular chaperone Hsp20 [Pseudoroseomonas rhizosphaerae]|uniref:Molecular chaperone Hsp20 n=2 Tax=Teichococcus rhizosphaerae TaxID=1335062 RepID=A0A2C7A4A3_9PROT|nr:molecular chaperone Hsp20 [Pseudoroseomonas rhizosphaerae]
MTDDTTPSKPPQQAQGSAPAQTPSGQTPPAPAPIPGMPERFWQPLTGLRDEVDRIFDNFWRGFAGGPPRRGEMMQPWRAGLPVSMSAPAMDVVEDEKGYRIVAELPGMGQEDVELSLSGDTLTIKGEKKERREEKSTNYYLSERRFGFFSRSFELPQSVKRDGIEASFDKGVLTVLLPKTPDAAQQTRKIEVKSA